MGHMLNGKCFFLSQIRPHWDVLLLSSQQIPWFIALHRKAGLLHPKSWQCKFDTGNTTGWCWWQKVLKRFTGQERLLHRRWALKVLPAHSNWGRRSCRGNSGMDRAILSKMTQEITLAWPPWVCVQIIGFISKYHWRGSDFTHFRGSPWMVQVKTRGKEGGINQWRSGLTRRYSQGDWDTKAGISFLI